MGKRRTNRPTNPITRRSSRKRKGRGRKYGFAFSWKRAIGWSARKQKIARKIGIPLTKQGRQRKVGGWILRIFGL